MSLYSQEGNRKQASINDACRPNDILPYPNSLMAGIITDVYSVDRVDSKGNPLNLPGTYLTYTIQLAPTGVFIHNVPTLMSGGHTRFYTNTSAGPELTSQNTEETPFIIGQQVIVGFL